MTQLAKYRTLAFITLIKLERKNSVVDMEAHLGHFAAKIGISYNSYKKYRKICLELGLCKIENGHDRYIDIQQCIQVLGLTKINKHVHFFNKCKHADRTLIGVYDTIIKGITLNNFKQQQHNTNKNKDLKRVTKLIRKNRNIASAKDRAMVKHITKNARYHNLSTLEYCDSILLKELQPTEDSIKTGKYHLSKLLGLSPSTGINLLKDMIKDNTVKRTVIKFNVSKLGYSNDSFDLLRAKYPKFTVLPYSGNKSFNVYKGSRIELISQEQELHMS
jgi:hypothetical protein